MGQPRPAKLAGLAREPQPLINNRLGLWGLAWVLSQARETNVVKIHNPPCRGTYDGSIANFYPKVKLRGDS